MIKVKLGCVILAGGKSSRMGSDKAFLEWNGKNFIKRLTDELDFFEEKMIAHGNRREIKKTTWSVIEDIYPDRGPIGGLHAALTACNSDALFCVTCDVPLVQCSLVTFLQNQLDETCDAVVPMAEDGRHHPLCAIYRKTTASAFKKQIEEGNNRIMNALEHMRVKFVRVEDVELACQLFNVNTQEDYLKLQKLYPLGHPL